MSMRPNRESEMNAAAKMQTSRAETLESIETPALVLDLTRVERNIARLTQRLG